LRLVLSGVDYREVGPQHLHAAMCALLDAPNGTTDPGAAKHTATRKPWSVGPVHGDGRHAFVTVGALSESVAAALHRRAGLGAKIVLNRQEGVVVDDPQLVTETPWAELATPTSADTWDIEFRSPTSLASGSRYTPFLDPAALVGGLSRRWEAAADLRPAPGGRELWLPRMTREELAELWVSDIEGRTEVVRIPHRASNRGRPKVVPGFVGTIRLRAAHPAVAAVTDCLLRFAEYAGVGACVTHGLGAVKVTPVSPGRRPGR